MQIDPYKLILEVFESYFPGIDNNSLAKALKINNVTLWNYKNGKGPINNAKSAKKVFAKLFDLAALKLVAPIYEFCPITPAVRKKGGHLYLFEKEKEKQFGSLISVNGKPTKGIYVFYNSQKEVVYVGKTERGTHRSLLDEMNNQLNRVIELYGVKSQNRKNLKMSDLRQGEIVKFFSAYHVPFNKAIHNIEALLIRAYANDNTNFQMAQFKNSLA